MKTMDRSKFACPIDYAATYSGYLNTGVPKAVVEDVANLASRYGVASVVDLGAGDASLVQGLARVGLDGLADVPLGGFTIPGLLLAHTSSETREQAAEAVQQRFAGQEHLTLCLDTLARLGRSDLPSALKTLHRIANRLVLVSLHTAPSRNANRYHPTLVPLPVWKRALEIAGFRIVDDRVFGGSCPLRRSIAQGAERHAWELLDPFRDASEDHQACLLLEKIEPALEGEQVTAQLRSLFRVRQSQPVTGDLASTDWHFLLGHIQDFSLFQPFWDALPAERIRVWIRRGPDRMVPESRGQAIEAYLASRGIAFRNVRETTDTDWAQPSPNRRLLLSAAESSAGVSHLLTSAFVAEAAYQGLPTFLLQHGIWVEDFPNPVAFASSHILSWSTEHEACFRQPSQHRQGPRGSLDGTAFSSTGCPKFDPYTGSQPVRLETIFGDWVSTFRRTVLCTTNLHWPQHKMSKADYYAALFQAASRDPETLFVIKLHPMEEPDEEILVASPRNVVHLPELAAWFLDLRTTDLVRAADVVVTTLSTVALEAGLAGRPLIVLDTGNRYTYEGIALHPLENLAQLLEQPEPAPARFVEHYYDTERLGNALDTCLNAITARLEGSPVGVLPGRAQVLARALGRQLASYAAEVERLREQAAMERQPDHMASKLVQNNLKMLQLRLDRMLEENEQLKSTAKPVDAATAS